MKAKDRTILYEIVRGSGIVFISTMISKAIMYLYRIFTARQLGPELYGILNLCLAIFWVSVNLSNSGIGPGINRKVSEMIGKKKGQKVKKYFWSSLDFSIPLSLFIGAMLFLLSDILATKAFGNPDIGTYLKLFAVAVPLQSLFTNLEAYANAHRNVIYPSFADKICRSAFTLGITAAALYLGYGLTAVVIIQVLGIAISSLMMAYFAERKVRSFLSDFAVSRSIERKDLVRYSLPLFLSGIMAMTMGKIDSIFLGIFDTAETLGVYTAAFPTAQIIAVIGGSVSTLLFPVVSEYYAEGKKQRSIEITSIALKWTFAASFPLLILMVVFATPILALLFGDVYTSGATALAVLGTAYFIQTAVTYPGTFINTEDMTRLVFYNSIAVTITNVVLNLVLIPLYSQTGASIATATALTLGTILAALEVYYLFDVQPYRLKDILPPFVATAVSGTLVYTITRLIFDVTPKWALIPGLGLFCGLYAFIFLALGGFSDEDIEMLKEIDQRTEVNLEIPKEVFAQVLNKRDKVVRKVR